MRKWTRPQDWTNASLGTYMLFVPSFTANSPDNATIWAAEVLGGLIVLTALWALAAPRSQGAEWTNATLGGLLFVAPWLFGYADLGGAAGNAWVVGALVASLSLWALGPARRTTGDPAATKPS